MPLATAARGFTEPGIPPWPERPTPRCTGVPPHGGLLPFMAASVGVHCTSQPGDPPPHGARRPQSGAHGITLPLSARGTMEMTPKTKQGPGLAARWLGSLGWIL